MSSIKFYRMTQKSLSSIIRASITIGDSRDDMAEKKSKKVNKAPELFVLDPFQETVFKIRCIFGQYGFNGIILRLGAVLH